jgi:hypothetical protein
MPQRGSAAGEGPAISALRAVIVTLLQYAEREPARDVWKRHVLQRRHAKAVGVSATWRQSGKRARNSALTVSGLAPSFSLLRILPQRR